MSEKKTYLDLPTAIMYLLKCEYDKQHEFSHFPSRPTFEQWIALGGLNQDKDSPEEDGRTEKN